MPQRLRKDLTELVWKICPKYYLKLKENNVVDQDVRTANCGYFCIRFLKKMFAGAEFMEATKYSDARKQEHEIDNMKKQLKKKFNFV